MGWKKSCAKWREIWKSSTPLSHTYALPLFTWRHLWMTFNQTTFDLQAMKESFAQERGECLDRMDRRALRERIAIERQQVIRDMALKRELAVWLDSKLTQIEQKHNLDAKNAALLRALAIKRFSKFRRSRQRVRNQLCYNFFFSRLRFVENLSL